MTRTPSPRKNWRAKFRTEKETAYTRWVKAEGLDIISAHYVRNLPHRRPPSRGAAQRRRRLHQSRGLAHLERLLRLRNPAGGKARAQRQLFEEMILILSGRGSTTVWNDEGKRITFEWKDGALFAIPLNCWHQHFNGSGTAPARYVAVTNAPPVYQPLRGPRIRVQYRPRLQEPLCAAARLFFPPRAEQKGLLLETNSSPTRSTAADQRQGTRCRRRSHPLQHGQGLDELTHLQFPIAPTRRARARAGAHVIVLSAKAIR